MERPKSKRLQSQAALNEFRGKPCLVCGNPSDPAHIKTRGSGGNDSPENILPLCRRHHTEQHAVGFVRFIEKHPVMEHHLRARGWEVESIFGAKKLVRK